MIKGFGFFEIFTDIIYLSDNLLRSPGSLEQNNFWLHQSMEINHNILRYSIQEYRPNELFSC